MKLCIQKVGFTYYLEDEIRVASSHTHSVFQIQMSRSEILQLVRRYYSYTLLVFIEGRKRFMEVYKLIKFGKKCNILKEE